MALPPTIRVKLSSEAAGSISLTPVVAQEMALRDLVEHMLGVTGKDEARIRELLLRGSVVSGASRFRWAGWEADAAGVRELLDTFPDPDPALAFRPTHCTRVTLRGGWQTIEFTREAASRKGMFQRKTYWELLMDVVGAAAPEYEGYSYRERADRYTRELSIADVDHLRGGCDLVRYSTLRDLLRTVGYTHAEIYATR